MSTNFFERQDEARRQTTLLIVYFAIAVVAIVVSVYLIVALIFAATEHTGDDAADTASTLVTTFWNPELFAAVAAATSTVVAAGSLYKIAALQAGGQAVALELGGRLVDPQTSDFVERRLLNVVEEMSIASGVPVPPVYILDQEESINAFAAGFTTGDAVIAVTRGTLRYLNRDELQGVIGHEFSHILNGDMRLNLRLMGLISGILIISTIGWLLFRVTANSPYIAMRSDSDDDRKRGDARPALIMLGLALVAIGSIGVLFGRLIKAAIARRREILADASATQFTRNPLGLASALKKIGGLEYGSRIMNPHAEEASHLFFGESGSGWVELFSTHPPLDLRIKELDPTFDGVYPEVKPLDETEDQETGVRLELDDAESQSKTRRSSRDRLQDVMTFPFPGSVGGSAAGRSGFPPTGRFSEGAAAIDASIAAGLVDATSGRGESNDVRPERGRGKAPRSLDEASRNAYSARALVYAILLDDRPEVRSIQERNFMLGIAQGEWNETARLAVEAAGLDRDARLSLVLRSIGTLRSLSPVQYYEFRRRVESLILADRRVDLFEFMLKRMLIRRLDQAFGIGRSGSGKPIDDVPRAFAIVLSRTAWEGSEGNSEAALRAYDRAIRPLDGVIPTFGKAILAESACDFAAVDLALDVLASAPATIRRIAFAAIKRCVEADGRTNRVESDLLRVYAEALDAAAPRAIDESPAIENTGAGT